MGAMNSSSAFSSTYRAGRSGISMPSRLPLPLRRMQTSQPWYVFSGSGALSRLTFMVSRSRSTLFTLPGPSGVWTKDSTFGIRLAASS